MSKSLVSKKKTAFLTFLFLVAIGGLAFASVISIFSGGESSKIFTFNSAGTQTGYFSIPLNANVSSASMNISGSANSDANLFWSVNSAAKFNAGTKYQTDYNTLDANGYLGLTAANSSGDYNSIIFDSNTVADWNKLLLSVKNYNCPTGMAFIPKLGGYCIDQYEASHSDATYCANNSSTDSCQSKIGTSNIAASVANRIPWVLVTQVDANAACGRAGKRLCTSAEWLGAANLNGQTYNLSDAVTDANCVVSTTFSCTTHSIGYGSACNTGSNKDRNAPSNCKSREGVFDLIGNVWEWTLETVNVSPSANLNSWHYPNDSTNPTLWNNSSPSARYGNDGIYLGSYRDGHGVLRGGAFNNTSQSGFFAMDLSSGPIHVI